MSSIICNDLKKGMDFLIMLCYNDDLFEEKIYEEEYDYILVVMTLSTKIVTIKRF